MRRVVTVEVQPNLTEGAVARHIIGAALQGNHANAEQIADVELATAELVTNAVEASIGNAPLWLSMVLSDDDVHLSVANHGAEFQSDPKSSQPGDVRGRGLSIVRALGAMTVEFDDGTTTVSVDVTLSTGAGRAPDGRSIG